MLVDATRVVTRQCRDNNIIITALGRVSIYLATTIQISMQYHINTHCGVTIALPFVVKIPCGRRLRPRGKFTLNQQRDRWYLFLYDVLDTNKAGRYVGGVPVCDILCHWSRMLLAMGVHLHERSQNAGLLAASYDLPVGTRSHTNYSSTLNTQLH